jgi:hypothetical protein
LTFGGTAGPEGPEGESGESDRADNGSQVSGGPPKDNKRIGRPISQLPTGPGARLLSSIRARLSVSTETRIRPRSRREVRLSDSESRREREDDYDPHEEERRGINWTKVAAFFVIFLLIGSVVVFFVLYLLSLL